MTPKQYLAYLQQVGLPKPEYDQSIIYAPSYVLAEQLESQGLVFEGKAIGTAREADIVLTKNLGVDPIWVTNPEKYAGERKKGATVGRRKMKEATKKARKSLLTSIARFESGVIKGSELKKQMVKTMKVAWRDSFLAGVRASGTPGVGKGKKGAVVSLTPADEKWLKSAMKHEMQFLNKFWSAIVEGTWKMPLIRRANMYVDALENFYESGKVIGLGQNTKITWAGPHDKKTCPSCQYMFEHNPYTKFSLPTTPRSGLTICLTNCRDKIVARRVDPAVYEKLLETGLWRSTHIKNLRKIKKQGHL